MTRSVMSRPMMFLVATVYGASWIVGPLNLLAFVLNALELKNPIGFIPMIVVPFGIILQVHYRLGWFPFRPRP
ncbi:MAG: hypothetical protein ACM3US_09190 [Sphingomonadaceae bacterium]